MSIVTVRGHVGGDPNHGISERGVVWARFRVAETERIHQQDGTWKDGETTWYSVSCFNETARNVMSAIKKGDPVIVVGKLKIDEWTREADGSTSQTPVLLADGVGHDLRFGLSQFARKQRADSAVAPPGQQQVPPSDKPDNVDEDGVIHGAFEADGAGEPGESQPADDETPEQAEPAEVSFTTSSPRWNAAGV